MLLFAFTTEPRKTISSDPMKFIFVTNLGRQEFGRWEALVWHSKKIHTSDEIIETDDWLK